MDSQHDNWAVHLKGAREIYKILFFQSSTDPAQEAKRLTEMNHPLRHFLISLLSYLDVAGACATSDGTVVEGSYWRTYAGGWEYNLGTPSLSSNQPPGEQTLVELRNCWSVMMEIQAAISAFGRAKHENRLAYPQQDIIYGDLLNRLLNWRATAPECMQVLDGLDDASLQQYPYPEVLEYAGCIEAYEKSTVIYLHKVAAANRPNRQTERPLIHMLASRILQLIGKCANGVGQLAVLWPLFTAGRETHDVTEQAYVRQTMRELQRYGFKVSVFSLLPLIRQTLTRLERGKRAGRTGTSVVQAPDVPRGMDRDDGRYPDVGFDSLIFLLFSLLFFFSLPIFYRVL